MPRIPPSLSRQARHIDPHLVGLLPICRDLPSAQNELRWLTEHAANTGHTTSTASHDRRLASYAARRAHGEPIQYILGSEYFGDLEIKCKPGVLIPRPETAATVSRLARLLSRTLPDSKLPDKLRVLDLCTGSGCIPLLFQHDFYAGAAGSKTRLDLVGIDISTKALRLATENHALQLDRHQTSGHASKTSREVLWTTRFLQADVLTDERESHATKIPSVINALQRLDGEVSTKCDILISNPPYISSKGFRSTTARSVRQYEPKLALVPPSSTPTQSVHDGDVFYPHILRLADTLEAKVMLLEVADMEQATRVAAHIIQRHYWEHVEIWKDDPDHPNVGTTTVGGRTVTTRGQGHGRSVFAHRGAGKDWRGLSAF